MPTTAGGAARTGGTSDERLRELAEEAATMLATCIEAGGRERDGEALARQLVALVESYVLRHEIAPEVLVVAALRRFSENPALSDGLRERLADVAHWVVLDEIFTETTARLGSAGESTGGAPC